MLNTALFLSLHALPFQAIDADTLAAARRIAAIAATEHTVPTRTVDVIHYALHVAIDPTARTITGHAELDVKPFGTPHRVLQLDADELVIQSVTDGAGVALAFTAKERLLDVDLGREATPEEALKLVIEYTATPRRGLVFVPRSDGSCAMVWSQGECQMASSWFPCRDYPDDRASSELFVTFPSPADAAWRSVGNGALIESKNDAGRRTDHWRMDFPHPAYLTSIAIGPFEEIDLGRVRDLPLIADATADLAAAATHSLQPTGAMVEALERLTGLPYPYPAYRQVCVAGFPYGGMENIGATTLAQDELIAPSDGDAGRTECDELVVHELAHQWFGDAVGLASWSDLWLSEGFATFAEPWWQEQRDPDAALAGWRHRQQHVLDEQVDHPQSARPVVSALCIELDDLFDSVVYERGGCILNLLRRTVGDEKFFAAVKTWIARQQGHSASSAEFEAIFEEACGGGLSDFFHEWLHSPGLPEIDFSWSWDPAAKRLELSAHQKQTGEGVPEVFHVPLEVAWTTVAGRKTARFPLDARVCRFSIECPEAPKYVRFNAGGALFGTLRVAQEGSAWREQLALESDPLGRAEAARELATAWKKLAADDESNRRLTLAALARALVEDPAVAVRSEAAAALGVVQGEVARTALGCAAWDLEPKVRAAAVEALGQFAHDELVAGMLLRRFENEKTGLVRATVLAALAESIGTGAVPTLLAFASEERAPAKLRGDALGAAGSIETLDDAGRAALADVARRLATPERPLALRKGAIAALAGLAGHSDAACDALAALLDDPALPIVAAVLSGLEDAATPERLLPALVRFHERAGFPDLKSRAGRLVAEVVATLPK